MAFLKDILNYKHSELSHVDPIITKLNGEKINESSGEVVSSSNEFFVVDASPDECLHEVIDGLFVGSQDASSNLSGLRENKITHILNVAIYCPNHFSEEFVYKNVEIYDNPEFYISTHFQECSSFINNALKSGGRVLCHCNAGVSRSVTIIVAYLMSYHKMRLDEALSTVKKNRPAAKPNVGFLEKLKELEQSLKPSKK